MLPYTAQCDTPPTTRHETAYIRRALHSSTHCGGAKSVPYGGDERAIRLTASCTFYIGWDTMRRLACREGYKLRRSQSGLGEAPIPRTRAPPGWMSAGPFPSGRGTAHGGKASRGRGRRQATASTGAPALKCADHRSRDSRPLLRSTGQAGDPEHAAPRYGEVVTLARTPRGARRMWRGSSRLGGWPPGCFVRG